MKRKTPTASPTAGRIASEQLCALSGLTDRRHRQLADQGYFPAPIKGQYQTTPTITGLFRFYKEYTTRHHAKRESIEEEKLRALKRENDEAAGLLVLKAEVAAELQKSLMPIKDTLRAKLENEAPREFSGMDVPQARILGKRLYDEICERFEAIFKKWKV